MNDEIAENIKQLIRNVSRTDRCVLCGKCSAVCPAFKVMREELHSPRGRIALIKAIMEGNLKPGKRTFEALDGCISCGACEMACATGTSPRLAGLLVRSLPELSGHYNNIADIPDNAPLDNIDCILLEKLGIRNKDDKVFYPPNKPISPSKKNRMGKVTYLVDTIYRCRMPFLTGVTIELLTGAGREVLFPGKPIISIEPFLLLGRFNLARRIAEQNLDILSSITGKIICDSASLFFSLKTCLALFFNNDDAMKSGRELLARLQLTSEFIRNRSFHKVLIEKNLRVTYLDSGSLKYGLKMEEIPRKMINSIQGVTRVGIPEIDIIPGWSGILTPKSKITQKVDAEIIDAVRRSDAEILILEDAPALYYLTRLFEKNHISLPVISFSQFMMNRY